MKKRTLNVAVVSLMLFVLVQTGQAQQPGRGAFGFGLSAGPARLQSDLKTDNIGYGGSADVSYSLGSGWGLASSLGFDSYTGTDNNNQTVYSDIYRADLSLTLDVLPSKPFNPFVYVGGGALFAFPRNSSGTSLIALKHPQFDSYALGGLGIDCYINESWSVILTAGGAYTTTDKIDGKVAGNQNDAFGRVSIGVRYYLFDRSTVEKLVGSRQK